LFSGKRRRKGELVLKKGNEVVPSQTKKNAKFHSSKEKKGWKVEKSNLEIRGTEGEQKKPLGGEKQPLGWGDAKGPKEKRESLYRKRGEGPREPDVGHHYRSPKGVCEKGNGQVSTGPFLRKEVYQKEKNQANGGSKKKKVSLKEDLQW